MAQQSMAYTRATVAGDVEILYNSEYVGDAVTLDTTAFTDGVCKAGTPLDKDGKLAVTTPASGETAASSTAVGVLLFDVYGDRPQGTIVIGGYINTGAAQTHSGVTIDATARAALKNIVFM